ncbi:hypothetical protein C1646_754075 [Rhizophagus diaphanus]|nr:hypothetical protein C1646_754075 [Rhizophagus diaphanus] [Rhizophagus sp. MUCL 43196]
MDGVHIPIYGPSKNGVCYINCKSFHFINLLEIVNHQECFIYIHADEANLLSSENVNREIDNDINGNNEYKAENKEMEEMVNTQKREYLADLIIN